MKRIQDAGQEAMLPPAPTASRLIAWLLEVGPAMPGGASLAPLTHTEIRSWQLNTGLHLTAWEVRTLRELSQAYLTELHLGEKPDQAAPFRGSLQQQMASVANDMRSEMRALAEL
jgi:hypothetical protein